MPDFENKNFFGFPQEGQKGKEEGPVLDGSREGPIQESIKKIEGLSIGPYPKAEIMLVLLGQKPATELDIYPWNDDMEKVKSTLEEAGVSVKEQEQETEEEGEKVGTLVVARDNNVLEKLEDLDPARDHEEYGKMMGYPETAVKAFLNKEQMLPEEDYPDMEDIIFNYKLSRDNWEEELRHLKKWSDSIKEYSPQTFNDLKGE